MKLHNTMEDMVMTRAKEIFETLAKEGNPQKYCTCEQCRLHIICYVLNRVRPHYIVSNRGASRVRRENVERQQQVADITTLIHEGLRQVNHNQRPNFDHTPGEDGAGNDGDVPVFNIPTIIGRLLNGINFAPIFGLDIELLLNGKLVPMKDANWQNPYHIVPHTEGAFSFWPAAVPASSVNESAVFECALRVSVPQFETLNHFFKIAVTSEPKTALPFSLERTFKLPDLYMFPPGEAEQNG